MATSASTARTVAASDLEPANRFELSDGADTITYTVSSFAGERQLHYNGRTFTGDEIRLEQTALGTLPTVELEVIPDRLQRLLTLVLPEVLVEKNGPEKFSAPVIFHTIKSSIAGPPQEPGPVQTYDVRIFSGTASRVTT